METITLKGTKFEIRYLRSGESTLVTVFVTDSNDNDQFGAMVRGVQAQGWEPAGGGEKESRSYSKPGMRGSYSVTAFRFRKADPNAVLTDC
jgi:hypothetical protein